MSEKERHPAPWKWVDFMGGIFRLEDATGMQILFPVSGGIVFGSHEARELTAAAGEMEALLRREAKHKRCERIDDGSRLVPCGECWADQAHSLIARIDAARARTLADDEAKKTPAP